VIDVIIYNLMMKKFIKIMTQAPENVVLYH